MGMFDKPKTITPAPKKALERKKPEIAIAGVEKLAMIKALQNTLETLHDTIESEVKGVAFARFADEIAQTGKRPDNFTAVEGGAHASLQLRRKSSAHALSDEAVLLLHDAGIEPSKTVVTPELFAINPAYAGDTALLAKVEKALAKIVPADFIMVQPEVSKLVATEDTLDAAIRAKAGAPVIAALTTVSCGSKLRNTDLSAILDFVRDLVDAPVFGSAAEQVRESAKLLRVVK